MRPYDLSFALPNGEDGWHVNMPYINNTRRERGEAAGLDEGQDEQPAHELDEEEKSDHEEGIEGDDENNPRRLNRSSGQRQRVTQCEFYSYLMSIRNYFNTVLAGGPLTQQWIVDSYVKIEENRVKYIREHQAELRVAKYNGLMNYVNNRAENENCTLYHPVSSEVHEP